MEVHNQAAFFERQLRRGGNQVCWKNSAPLYMNVFLHNIYSVYKCTVKNVYPQDVSEYMQFLRESHSEALKEEERRHRFLAEKHCGLIQSIAHLMNKVYNLLQIAFVNSIFYDLFWLIDYRCHMGRVCHTNHSNERQKDSKRKALKRKIHHNM